eukprot:g9734.t1
MATAIRFIRSIRKRI